MKCMFLYCYSFLFIFSWLIISTYQNDYEIEKPLIICNKYTCPKSRGVCNEENECICIRGYDTVDDLSKGDFYCNYKKKSKLITFLLEFVIGYGSGHFYIGNVSLATIKMIYTSLACLLFCQFNSIKKITEIKKVAVPLERVLLLGWIAWQLIDGLLIFFGYYKDRNGHELRGW